MPCYDSRSTPEYVKAEALREFTHNSPLAEMLCALMRQVEAGEITEWPPGLFAWWQDHKARDAKRGAA